MKESYVKFGKITCPCYEKGKCIKGKKSCDGECQELIDFFKILKLCQ